MNKSFDAINGFEKTKQALIVAAVGRHNVLLLGKNQYVKQVLAKRMQYILPWPSTFALESTAFHIVKGLHLASDWLLEYPPFRSLHYTISSGNPIYTNCALESELLLAKNGILYLDSIEEFYITDEVLSVLKTAKQHNVMIVATASCKIDDSRLKKVLELFEIVFDIDEIEKYEFVLENCKDYSAESLQKKVSNAYYFGNRIRNSENTETNFIARSIANFEGYEMICDRHIKMAELINNKQGG